MRIAQIAPLAADVSPRLQEDAARIVLHLADALVRAGHEVTLFAGGEAPTEARLAPHEPGALRAGCGDAPEGAAQLLLVERALRASAGFDIAHFHMEFLHFAATRRAAATTLTTLHGRVDRPGLSRLFEEYDDQPVVAISEAQRGRLPGARWVGVVHGGVPADLYAPCWAPGEGLVFLGRIAPETGAETAIAIARAAGVPLRLAGRVAPAARDYFEDRVRPLIDGRVIEHVGPVEGRSRQALLGGARALLFTADWPDPLGLPMIEAMACGAPVIAFRRGAAAEIVEDGVTGRLVDGPAAAVAAVETIDRIDRRAARRRFEDRFTAERMARDYLALYAGLVAPQALGAV